MTTTYTIGGPLDENTALHGPQDETGVWLLLHGSEETGNIFLDGEEVHNHSRNNKLTIHLMWRLCKDNQNKMSQLSMDPHVAGSLSLAISQHLYV